MGKNLMVMLQSIVDKWGKNEKMGENLMVMLQSIVDKWKIMRCCKALWTSGKLMRRWGRI